MRKPERRTTIYGPPRLNDRWLHTTIYACCLGNGGRFALLLCPRAEREHTPCISVYKTQVRKVPAENLYGLDSVLPDCLTSSLLLRIIFGGHWGMHSMCTACVLYCSHTYVSTSAGQVQCPHGGNLAVHPNDIILDGVAS